MQYHGTISTVAIKHNCHSVLNFGLATNQLILQRDARFELTEKIKQIPVYINPRLTSAAGKAFYCHNKYGMHIQLHSALVDIKDYVNEDFGNTFFHEIAHLIAFIDSKHQGHGFPWAYSFMQFGYTPTRCYNSQEFNYKGHRARQVQRMVNEIADDLPDFGLEAAKEGK